MIERYERFEYAEKLADKYPVPVVDEEDCFVEWQRERAFHVLANQPEKKIQELGISEEQFYRQREIIPVLEAYGLDKEKFWYAVVYVMLLTTTWSKQKGLNWLPTSVEQLTRMRDKIKGRREFKILIDNDTESHTIPMEGSRVVDVLVAALDKLIKKEEKAGWAEAHEITTWSRGNYKKTEQTWYAANLFKQLLDCLKLPVRRSKSTKKEYRTIEGHDILVKGADAEVTLDKNQLIAELIHFLGLTDNEDLDGNSIKGILNNKRKFELGIF